MKTIFWHCPWFVLWGPDSSCGALLRPPGPDSSCGALLRPAGPHPSRGALLIPRGPDPSCGALIGHSGPDSTFGALIRPAGPDSYCEALIRSVVPDLSRRALIHLAGPDLSCGALIRLAGPSRGARVRSVEPWFFLRGPDPSRRALKPDKKSTSARGPSGSRRPGFGLEGKKLWYMLVPGDWPLGGMARMSPWDRHCHGVHFQTRLFPCTIAYICQKTTKFVGYRRLNIVEPGDYIYTTLARDILLVIAGGSRREFRAVGLPKTQSGLFAPPPLNGWLVWLCLQL